jgi:hypothetical protein
VFLTVLFEYKASLDDAQALDALVSCFRNAANDGQEEERRQSYFSPLRKRLVLVTIIDRRGGADSRKA